MFITGKKVTIDQQVNNNKEIIKAAVRDIEKEAWRIEFENKNLLAQVRQAI